MIRNLLTIFFSLSLVQCGDATPVPQEPRDNGGQVGNGGKAVVCRDATDTPTSIEVLDYYEAREVYGLSVKLDGDTTAQKVHTTIRRLASHDQQRMQRYERYAQTFTQDSQYLGVPLFDTKDSDHIISPKQGCKIEQLAVQISPELPTDRRYNFNRELWNIMNEDQRAGIVLHEIIYREAIMRGHKNSRAVRFLNALLSSNSLTELDQQGYESRIRAAKLFDTKITTPDNREWILIGGLPVVWRDAEQACKELVAGALPSADDIQIDGFHLASVGLMGAIKDHSLTETWGRERSAATGLVSITAWQSGDWQQLHRDPKSSSSVLCIKQ